MITDDINKIKYYDQIPDSAKNFILSLSPNIKLGKYDLDNGIYANVEQYITKPAYIGKFEAHREYIDIQIVISGCENIYYTPIDNLNELIPYDGNKDILFYSNTIEEKPFVTLDGSNFILLYPQDAHAPQIKAGSEKESVLKAVVKIPI